MKNYQLNGCSKLRTKVANNHNYFILGRVKNLNLGLCLFPPMEFGWPAFMPCLGCPQCLASAAFLQGTLVYQLVAKKKKTRDREFGQTFFGVQSTKKAYLFDLGSTTGFSVDEAVWVMPDIEHNRVQKKGSFH